MRNGPCASCGGRLAPRHAQALSRARTLYAAVPGDDIFDANGIDRSGALVIVRPDMYVAHVLPLSAREEITEFFAQSMVSQRDAAVLATAEA